MSDFNPSTRILGDFMQPAPRLGDRLKSLVITAAPNILVVDISHYNGEIDWDVLKASGVKGVIMKVSESTTYKDTMFEENWQAARDNSMAVMLYHFFRDKPGKDEFDWFMQCASNFLDDCEGNTAVALDVETNNGVTKVTRADRAFEFCRLAKEAGLLDGIYCSPSLVDSLFPYGETRWSNLAWQWVAHWTSAATYTLPAGWSNSLVKCWQIGISPTHSWVPKISGAGTVDVNRMYFACEDDLKRWLGQDEAPLYPFMVRVVIGDGTLIREAPKAGQLLRIEPLDAGLAVFGSLEDVDGALWYDTGAGWVRASHTEKA